MNIDEIATRVGPSKPAWAKDIVPTVMPVGWFREHDPRWWIYRREDGLLVLATGAVHGGERWLHVSMSFRNRLPSYSDICEVKDLVIGADRRALQVFPPRSEHVNIHPNCLHLWCCVDDDGLPDFTEGTGTI